ncbi:HD superfamily phosphohydrolase [Fusobacterium sp. PH5-44]
MTKSIKKAINSGFLDALTQDNTILERHLKIFEYACLLHDVGHAPFSHTGENHYLENGTSEKLHDEIIKLIDDANLTYGIKEKEYGASPHELMSVIVGLKIYKNLFADKYEMNFFMRCITGYLYKAHENNKMISFCNCLISLLNSKIIDVDRLDYLIRDSYISGFDTIKIDYRRLIDNVMLVVSEGKVEICYSKGAISVIENVIYAHDAERKWIQNHPVIQYEIYLLNEAINIINAKYLKEKIFSYNALTEVGVELSKEFRLSFLSDVDILFLMKNSSGNKVVSEYFSRKDRRYPIWKTESEYKALFNKVSGETIFKKLEETFEQLNKYLLSVNCSQVIDEKAIKACNKNIKEVEKKLNVSPNGKLAMISEKNNYKKWLLLFKKFAADEKIGFDFIILEAKQFNSGFSKRDIEKVKIKFSDSSELFQLKKVTNILTAQESEREKFYYIFYRRKIEKKINSKKLVARLVKMATDEVLEV